MAEELLCMVCRDLLQDAVLIPCCGNSFCDECVRQVLLESDNHECPLCHEIYISPDTVIPNRYLRTAVLNFKNETGYTRIKKIAQISSTHPVHVESPQPSPVSTVENQPVQPLPTSSDDAIYEMPCPSSSNQDNPNVFEEIIVAPPEQETAIQQSIGISSEYVQPGTTLTDEPPIDILPQTVTSEGISHEETGDRHSYDIEPVYSEYPQDVDPGSRDNGKVSSSEHQNINTIITKGSGHGSDSSVASTTSSEESLLNWLSTDYNWIKPLGVVERRDNYDLCDRLGSHERFYRTNRDKRLPSRPVQCPLKPCTRFIREPREPRYCCSENRHDFHDYATNNEQAENSINYDVQTHVEESVHGHQQRYNSLSAVLPQHRLGGPPPYSIQATSRQHGPFHSTPQPFPPQPPPPDPRSLGDRDMRQVGGRNMRQYPTVQEAMLDNRPYGVNFRTGTLGDSAGVYARQRGAAPFDPRTRYEARGSGRSRLEDRRKVEIPARLMTDASRAQLPPTLPSMCSRFSHVPPTSWAPGVDMNEDDDEWDDTAYDKAVNRVKILKNLGHTITSKPIDPKRAKVRPGVKKIFVGGLETDSPEAEIKAYFEKHEKSTAGVCEAASPQPANDPPAAVPQPAIDPPKGRLLQRVSTDPLPQSLSMICVPCRKVFSSKAARDSHAKRHQVNRPYKCSICNNTFKSKASRTNHEIVHSNNTPYKCIICANTFKRLGDLTNHTKSHSLE